MKKTKVHSLVISALMTATLAIISQLAVPTPFGIPLTLQTFAVCLCGYVLGTKYGFISTLLYVVMGAIGLPVFYGLRGGISCIIAEPTGGFIIGFIPLVLLCGAKKYLYFTKRGRWISLVAGFIGITTCHLCGILLYSVVTHINFFASAAVVSFPFILKDLILCVIAYILSGKIIISLKKTGFNL